MKTLVIGASEDPSRYANKAIRMLLDYEHEVLAIASRKGSVQGIVFHTEKVNFEGVDTVTLYINPQIQTSYYSYIQDLKPRRVIFNPGTENQEFIEILQQVGVECVEACTLVMLRTNQY